MCVGTLLFINISPHSSVSFSSTVPFAPLLDAVHSTCWALKSPTKIVFLSVKTSSRNLLGIVVPDGLYSLLIRIVLLPNSTVTCVASMSYGTLTSVKRMLSLLTVATSLFLLFSEFDLSFLYRDYFYIIFA
jgi:hypothetical protein